MLKFALRFRYAGTLVLFLFAVAAFLFPQRANAGVAVVGGMLPGPTPFVEYVGAYYSGGTIKEVGYVIHPKAGSKTRAFETFYSAAYLNSIHFIVNNNLAVISVFGLGGNFLADFATANSGTTLELQGLGTPYANKIVFDLQYPQAGCGTGWNALPIEVSYFNF